MDEKILARQCLNFKGFYCDNTECKNKTCPLHYAIKDNHAHHTNCPLDNTLRTNNQEVEE